MQSLADGGFLIYGLVGANAEGGKQFYVQAGQHGMTPPGVKSAMAVALLAFATGKNITFAYDNATTHYYVSTVLVSP